MIQLAAPGSAGGFRAGFERPSSLARRPRDLASARSVEGKSVGTNGDPHTNPAASGGTIHKYRCFAPTENKKKLLLLLGCLSLLCIGCLVLWDSLVGLGQGMSQSANVLAAATKFIARKTAHVSRSMGSLGNLGGGSFLGGLLLAPMEKVEALAHAKLTAGWSWILARFSHSMIGGVLTFAFHEVVYFGAWMPWLLMDQFSYFKRFKIQPQKKADSPMVWRCFNWLFITHFLFQLPMQLIFHPEFATALPLPPIREMLWQLPAFFVVEDFYFYWVHRALHHKSIYKYIHKVHHEHKHPFGIAAEYAHPVETVVLGFASILGPLIFQPHMVTLWAWLLVKLCQIVENHSGYDLPFNPTHFIPFWGGTVHHDFHHSSFDGCYGGIFTWCDWMFGTDEKFRAHQKMLRGGKEGYYPAQFRGALNVAALEANKAKAA